MSTMTAPSPIAPTAEAPAVRSRRSLPTRYIVPAAVLVGALGFLAGAAVADDDGGSAAVAGDDRCAQLRHHFELIPD